MNYLESLELTEESDYYRLTALLDNEKQAVLKTELNLKSNENFNKQNLLKEVFNRKNIIYYGKIQLEAPIKIKSANGELEIALINNEELSKQIEKIKDQQKRSKIGWIHISTIQVLIKSTYMKGINSPISLAICDKRITDDPIDQIIGIVHGNLANVNVKFNAHLGYAIPLSTENLGRSISLAYKFHRKNLMEQDDEPFSITYAINYALTNSHHSIIFKNRERIYVDELFQKIVKTEIPKYKAIENPVLLLKEPSGKLVSSNFQIRESKINSPLSLSKLKIKEENSEIKELTKKVEKLNETLNIKL